MVIPQEERHHSHVLIGCANPFLVCGECHKKVIYWHDPLRCNCDKGIFLSPCRHYAEAISVCPSWNTVNGCTCKSKEKHAI